MSLVILPRVKLMAARKVVRDAAPYFRTVLLRIQFEPCTSADLMGQETMGMTERGVCYYVPAFVDKTPVKELAAVLVHEMMHFLRNHAARFKTRVGNTELFQLWNCAADCEINDDLAAGGWALPGKPFPPNAPPGTTGYLMPSSIPMPEGRTAEEYFAELRKRAKPAGKGGSGQGQPSGQQVAGGECGGCAGNPREHEKKLGAGGSEKQPGDGKSGPQEQPSGGGMGESEQDRVRAQTAREIQNHVAQKGRGNVPAGLARWAGEQLKPPRVHWREKLKRATRRCVQACAGATDYRWTHISRRQAGLGFGMGAPRLPALRGNLPSVAVIVDTSGSMGGDQLAEGLSETDGVLRALGAPIQFCAIDCDSEGVVKVRSWREAAVKLKGGGGTDMKPAFRMLLEQRNPPSVAICITDGMIGDPGPAPAGMHVIWLLVGSTYTNDVSKFGEVIILDPKDDQP